MNTINLQKDEMLISGEKIIDIPITFHKEGVIRHKESIEKCPHCCTGVGKKGSKTTNEKGVTEIYFSCQECKKTWFIRFKNPYIEINYE